MRAIHLTPTEAKRMHPWEWVKYAFPGIPRDTVTSKLTAKVGPRKVFQVTLSFRKNGYILEITKSEFLHVVIRDDRYVGTRDFGIVEFEVHEDHVVILKRNNRRIETEICVYRGYVEADPVTVSAIACQDTRLVYEAVGRLAGRGGRIFVDKDIEIPENIYWDPIKSLANAYDIKGIPFYLNPAPIVLT